MIPEVILIWRDRKVIERQIVGMPVPPAVQPTIDLIARPSLGGYIVQYGFRGITRGRISLP